MYTFINLPYSNIYKICLQTYDIIDATGKRYDIYLNAKNDPVLKLDWFDGLREYQLGLIPFVMRM